MKDGNNEKIQGEASIGLISAKLNFEGMPIDLDFLLNLKIIKNQPM